LSLQLARRVSRPAATRRDIAVLTLDLVNAVNSQISRDEIGANRLSTLMIRDSGMLISNSALYRLSKYRVIRSTVIRRRYGKKHSSFRTSFDVATALRSAATARESFDIRNAFLRISPDIARSMRLPLLHDMSNQA